VDSRFFTTFFFFFTKCCCNYTAHESEISKQRLEESETLRTENARLAELVSRGDHERRSAADTVSGFEERLAASQRETEQIRLQLSQLRDANLAMTSRARGVDLRGARATLSSSADTLHAEVEHLRRVCAEQRETIDAAARAVRTMETLCATAAAAAAAESGRESGNGRELSDAVHSAMREVRSMADALREAKRNADAQRREVQRRDAEIEALAARLAAETTRTGTCMWSTLERERELLFFFFFQKKSISICIFY
jgi:chromosome segregation ATPase